jgi:hypothetical protein
MNPCRFSIFDIPFAIWQFIGYAGGPFPSTEFDLPQPKMFQFLLYAPEGIDASAINCWRPNRNLRAWHSLRLNSRPSVIISKVSRSNEESLLSKQAMPARANKRGWK